MQAVSFAARTTFTGPTATGTGAAMATVSGGGATCGFDTSQFVNAPSPLPAGVSFPHGLFNFTLTGCGAGGSATLTITYPSPLPTGTQYWKFGPTASDATAHWYTIAATIGGSSVTFTLIDGGLGDDDLLANGSIVDAGGPGLPGPSGAVAPIPTLSQWAMVLLAGLLALFGLGRVRRQTRS